MSHVDDYNLNRKKYTSDKLVVKYSHKSTGNDFTTFMPKYSVWKAQITNIPFTPTQEQLIKAAAFGVMVGGSQGAISGLNYLQLQQAGSLIKGISDRLQRDEKPDYEFYNYPFHRDDKSSDKSYSIWIYSFKMPLILKYIGGYARDRNDPKRFKLQLIDCSGNAKSVMNVLDDSETKTDWQILPDNTGNYWAGFKVLGEDFKTKFKSFYITFSELMPDDGKVRVHCVENDKPKWQKTIQTKGSQEFRVLVDFWK